MVASLAEAPAVIATNFWAWHAHPEVWLLVASVAGLYVWAGRTIGPKVVPAGTPADRPRRRSAGSSPAWRCCGSPRTGRCTTSASTTCTSVHMIQHLLLTFVLPPLFLLGTPEWLARLVIGDGKASVWIKRFCRPGRRRRRLQRDDPADPLAGGA